MPFSGLGGRRWSSYITSPVSALEPCAELLLALLGTLAALCLRPTEELRKLGVAVALGVLDVDVEAQRVLQAREINLVQPHAPALNLDCPLVGSQPSLRALERLGRSRIDQRIDEGGLDLGQRDTSGSDHRRGPDDG